MIPEILPTPATPRPPTSELHTPRPKCIGVKLTPEIATLTHYHHAEARHYNVRMPRSQWDEILRTIAEGHTDFIYNCTPQTAALHHLDALPLDAPPAAAEC